MHTETILSSPRVTEVGDTVILEYDGIEGKRVEHDYHIKEDVMNPAHWSHLLIGKQEGDEVTLPLPEANEMKAIVRKIMRK